MIELIYKIYTSSFCIDNFLSLLTQIHRRKNVGLWTLTHFYQIIPSFLIFALLSILAAKILGKAQPSVRYIPLQIIAVTLLVLEAIKQINAVSNGSYNLYALPFHYCSLFLYFLPFHAFYHGKYSRIINVASLAFLASLMLDMLITPTVIYTDDNIRNFFNAYYDFHTVAFHNLVVFYFMLTVALKLYEKKDKSDLKILSVFISIYLVIATTLSYTLKVNFHNLYRCNVAFIDNVRVAMVESIGIFGTILYVLILSVLTLIFTSFSYYATHSAISGIDKLVAKFKQKQEKK